MENQNADNNPELENPQSNASYDEKKITQKSETSNPQKKKKVREFNEEQREVLKQAFDAFDANKSGNIDEKELMDAMKALGFNPTKEDVITMINDVDADGSGTIEYDEFLSMMQIKMIEEKDLEEEMRRAFRWYDEIDDEFGDEVVGDSHKRVAYIDKEKLMSVAKNTIAEGVDEYIIDRMIEVADSDGDGKVTEEDFLKIMKFMKLY